MSPTEIVRFVPRPEQYAWTFGGYEPVRSIRAGEVLSVYTEDCFAGRIRGPDDLPSRSIEYPFINPQTGPFFVEGAEPGDTLAVHLIEVRPARDWGVSTLTPMFGSLSTTRYTATLHDALPERVWIYHVDEAAGQVEFRATDSEHVIRLPLEPFHGTIGVAPAAGEVRNVLVPESFGGNMDTPEARAGTTLFFGVNVPGAMLSIGDGHYRQGEGEACGVAVEGSMDTVLTVDVIKGAWCAWPRLEDDESIMVAGSYRPLEDAYRIAHAELVRWIADAAKMSTWDAYQLVTQVATSRIANVVDPNYTVVAKAPKRFLPPDVTWMGGVHARLRALGAEVLAAQRR